MADLEWKKHQTYGDADYALVSGDYDYRILVYPDFCQLELRNGRIAQFNTLELAKERANKIAGNRGWRHMLGEWLQGRKHQ